MTTGFAQFSTKRKNLSTVELIWLNCALWSSSKSRLKCTLSTNKIPNCSQLRLDHQHFRAWGYALSLYLLRLLWADLNSLKQLWLLWLVSRHFKKKSPYWAFSQDIWRLSHRLLSSLEQSFAYNKFLFYFFLLYLPLEDFIRYWVVSHPSTFFALSGNDLYCKKKWITPGLFSQPKKIVCLQLTCEGWKCARYTNRGNF